MGITWYLRQSYEIFQVEKNDGQKCYVIVIVESLVNGLEFIHLIMYPSELKDEKSGETFSLPSRLGLAKRFYFLYSFIDGDRSRGGYQRIMR